MKSNLLWTRHAHSTNRQGQRKLLRMVTGAEFALNSTNLHSLAFTWIHVDSLAFSWAHLGSLNSTGFAWKFRDSYGHTRVHLKLHWTLFDSLSSTRTPLDSPALILTHQLGLTRSSTKGCRTWPDSLSRCHHDATECTFATFQHETTYFLDATTDCRAG